MARVAERTLRIGELAQRAGVGVDALRFYEREGLFPAPEREASSGYRRYPAETVRIVRFVREAQRLGFTLKEISELLRLGDHSAVSCADVREAATAKLADVDRRIAQLTAMRAALEGVVESCGSPECERTCSVLDCFGDGPDACVSPCGAPDQVPDAPLNGEARTCGPRGR